MDITMISAQYISERVQQALAEDVGAGDITASLIAPDALASADVITREAGVLCGKAFADETFQQVDGRCSTVWQAADGEPLNEGDTLFRVTGPARALLTAERTALNFLQALSGTATVAKDYADRVSHTDVRLLDTRKTVPGLRARTKICGRLRWLLQPPYWVIRRFFNQRKPHRCRGGHSRSHRRGTSHRCRHTHRN